MKPDGKALQSRVAGTLFPGLIPHFRYGLMVGLPYVRVSPDMSSFQAPIWASGWFSKNMGFVRVSKNATTSLKKIAFYMSIAPKDTDSQQ
jgi:hypothetical protein